MVYPHTYRTEHSETRTTNAIYGDYYAKLQSKRIKIQPELLKILKYVDSNRQTFVDDLQEAVQIRSVSSMLRHVADMQKMVEFTEAWLSRLGLKYECFNIGFRQLEGQKVRLPSVILASYGKDARKKTVAVYAYLDVKEPDVEKWESDPWNVTKVGNCFYGNGISSGKGALLAWFHVLQAFQETNTEVPVNLKFIIESMHHEQSAGLADFVALRKHDFMANIDSIIVCDSEWIGEKHPCIVYGTVGIVHYDVFLEINPEAKSDPNEELDKIFAEIVDDQENILIPKFGDMVTQITPEEEMVYEKIVDFDIEEVRPNLPEFKREWDQVKLLMNTWRLPLILIGETEMCTCDKNDKTLMKRHVVVKIVPRQIVDRNVELTVAHFENLVKKLDIKHKIWGELVSATRYWHEEIKSEHYQAARRATIQIYKEDPNMIREDRVNHPVTIFDRVLERDILLLPLVNKGSNSSRENENTSAKILYESTKLLGAYLFQIATAKEKKNK